MQSLIYSEENSTSRGSDELLTQTGTVNNGTVMSPHANHTDNNNDAKKVKLETRNQTNGKPSRVVHIRNIPNEVTEAEIVHLGIPFGRVTNVLVLKGKNQAFLEMHDENSATTMVAYFTNCSAQLRGRNVYVQFSNHKELKTDQSHSNANASAQAALQAAQAMAGQSETQGGPNTVLRVIIEHMVYPVTLDVLYQIFSRVGKVMKIVTFTKNNTFQALIQYPDVVTAQAAKLSLDGQNIYNACCTLRIEYSKLSSLNVKYNNDKSRDYTNPSLPTGDPALDSALALGDADYRRFRTIPYLIPQSEGGYMINPTIFDSLSFSNPTHSLTWNCCNSMSCLPTSDSHLCGGKDSLDSLIQIGSSSSIDTFNVNSGSYIYPPPGPSPNPAPGLFSSPLSIQDEWTSHNCMHKSPPRQGGGGSSFEGPNILPPCGFTGSPGAPGVLASHFAVHGLASPLTNPYGTSGAMPLAGVALPGGMTALGAAGLRLPGQSQSGCVLLISNLDEEAVTPDALFTLFGVYGDVQRVKILFNKKDSALLQMAEPHQAQLALSHLDKLKVWGKQIRVMPSKHQAVQMPKEGQPDAGLTKDYSNSSLHRFKKPGSKNYLNIYPPSSTLHLSNIPLNVDEDGIKEAFVNNGFEVKNFKFFPKDHKMALIQLESVEEAVLALVKLHNYQLSESNHLRVSFSKSTI